MQQRLLFLFFFISISVFSQCPQGDVKLKSQQELDNFIATYPNCTEINGDLSLSGNITDLSEFTQIVRIEGSLDLSYVRVNKISNFHKLEYVGGNLRMRNGNVESIEGMNNLYEIGGDFKITEGGIILKDIKGFENLRSVGGDFEINGNTAIESIPLFNSLEFISGVLAIGNNNELKKIAGFDQLREIGFSENETIVGSLFISGNDSLSEISGFNSLIKIQEFLNIISHYKLEKISGFSNLNSVNHFEIGNCNILIEIPLFQNLIEVGSNFEIHDTKLKSIEGFNNLQIIGSSDPALGNLYINRNESLKKISGFNNLRKLEGELGVTMNDSLLSIAGFDMLNEVLTVNITANKSLTNLDGLQGLFKVGSIGIYGVVIRSNESLTDCSALCNLFSNGKIEGDVRIFGNPSACSSEEEVREVCIPDFDDDLILDDDDLDDDNDGILDTVEQNGNPDRDTDGDGFPDHKDLDSDNDGCFDVIESGMSDPDQNGTLGDLPDQVDTDGLIINESGYITPLDNDNNNIPDFQEATLAYAGESGNLDICDTDSSVDLFDYLINNPDTGGVWTPALNGGGSIFDPSIDNSGTYTYTVTNGICGEDTSFVEVIVRYASDAGGDNSISLCSSDSPVDLFTLLKGTPDTGGTWSPALVSGSSIFDPAQDNEGEYEYFVNNTHCGSDSAIITVNVENAPDAGNDTSITICKDSNPVSLSSLIDGTPDPNGTFSPSLSSGGDIFDPKVDQPGDYTYTSRNTLCGADSSILTISIEDIPNPGLDADFEICANDPSINLYDVLGGLPDANGVWSPALNSGSGIFDPSLDSGGVYQYTVENSICGTRSSSVTIRVIYPPFAGTDNALELCNNSPSVDLFDYLLDNPDPNGTWSPPLSSGTSFFNPTIDSPGLYTYTVNNNLCGEDSATLDVKVLDYEPITDYEVIIDDLSQNNTVQIDIQSGGNYEFSLDGFTFQERNIFENVAGGDYILYAQQTDGCGILEIPVSVADYLPFFTPNGDGYHETWGLEGVSNRNFGIMIYDRYGKLLKQLSPNEPRWDGTYNGIQMPSDNYWFTLTLDDGRTRKGHFALKR